MNILHMRSEYLDNGPGTQPLRIAQEFKRRGHDSFFAGAKGIMDQAIKKSGYDFIEVPELSRNKRSPISFFRSVYKISKIIKENNISIIHSHNAACSFVAYFASLFCRSHKIRIVRSVRGVELRPTHQYRNLLYRFYPATLLAVCEYAKTKLISLGASEDNIIVTYNGADLTRFDREKLSYEHMRDQYNVQKDEILIGHVGAFSGWKGQEVLVEALPSLNLSTDMKVKLMFVGDGPAMTEAKDKVLELGLESQVIFVGRQMQSEVYHMALDIYCQPSTEGELFPNAIVEALALGKPWVGSDISGLSELTDNGRAGTVVEPGNVEALADALKPLILDEELRRKMGDRGYALVLDKLTIQKVCDRISVAYGL
ncbi:glycosyltransferase family 4 protein [Vibrio comitans]|uniref:Glycosyl transferase group 1 n=1 Tax=Vibrio comitans NBRC 102076 TaxID=1219078 RepID=A0A4Y3ITA6_9VIBR|nr:glycosyltransferase family 4 protein [Vibrio comitans]GEA61970.1 glycosyl transferase group 1 [Vibrio comitans NBRC 102076]